MTEVIRAKNYNTLYEQSVKDYNTVQANKVKAEYVRLSEENRKLKAEYLAAIEQVTDLQIRLKGLMTIIDLQEEVRA